MFGIFLKFKIEFNRILGNHVLYDDVVFGWGNDLINDFKKQLFTYEHDGKAFILLIFAVTFHFYIHHSAFIRALDYGILLEIVRMVYIYAVFRAFPISGCVPKASISISRNCGEILSRNRWRSNAIVSLHLQYYTVLRSTHKKGQTTSWKNWITFDLFECYNLRLITE